MEGDAGPGRLTPNPPTTDEAEQEAAEESVDEDRPVDADPTRTEGDPPTGQTEPADGPPAAASRLSGRRLVAVCVVLMVASVLVAAGGFVALRSHQKSLAAARAETAALAAAKDCVAATQAPNADAMAASQQKIIECATGDFGAQATLYSGLLVDAYQAAKVQVQVSNMRAAVERHNDDGSMDILVALRVKVSNTQAQDQEQGYRLRVRMMPDAGTYKIADLQQVSK